MCFADSFVLNTSVYYCTLYGCVVTRSSSELQQCAGRAKQTAALHGCLAFSLYSSVCSCSNVLNAHTDTSFHAQCMTYCITYVHVHTYVCLIEGEVRYHAQEQWVVGSKCYCLVAQFFLFVVYLQYTFYNDIVVQTSHTVQTTSQMTAHFARFGHVGKGFGTSHCQLSLCEAMLSERNASELQCCKLHQQMDQGFLSEIFCLSC